MFFFNKILQSNLDSYKYVTNVMLKSNYHYLAAWNKKNIFLSQIWFGEFPLYVFEVNNSCCVGETFSRFMCLKKTGFRCFCLYKKKSAIQIILYRAL